MEFSFLVMYLLACQVRVTTGDSGLFCCVHVMSFDHQCVASPFLNPFAVKFPG